MALRVSLRLQGPAVSLSRAGKSFSHCSLVTDQLSTYWPVVWQRWDSQKTKHVKGQIIEGNSCRSGFILSGFFLPETKSGRIPRFAIAFFLPDNQAGPGKPVFSIGESFQSHSLTYYSTPWRRVSAQPNPVEGRAQRTTEKARR